MQKIWPHPHPNQLPGWSCLWCCSFAHQRYSLQPSCTASGTAHHRRSCHLYLNHIVKKKSTVCCFGCWVVMIHSYLCSLHYLQWVRNEPKFFMNPWKFIYLLPLEGRHWWAGPPVGWWQVLESAGNLSTWGPHSHLWPGWWTSFGGGCFDSRKKPVFFLISLSSFLHSGMEAWDISSSGSSSWSSCTWSNSVKLKTKGIVHKYCTPLGKSVLHKRVS